MDMLIVDLEATCYDRGMEPVGFYSEIIEIGAIELNTNMRTIGKSFDTFVKPNMRVNAHLSNFCTELTTITDKDLVSVPRLNVAMGWLSDAYPNLHNMIFASWGDYDKNKLQRDCERFNIDYPFGPHISLKTEYANFYRVRKCGMDEALRQRGLPLVGTHHRGIDDVHNIANITVEMLIDGWMPQCN